MDKAHPLSSPMVSHSLDVKNDPFCTYEMSVELLGLEVPYLSAIGALIDESKTHPFLSSSFMHI